MDALRQVLLNLEAHTGKLQKKLSRDIKRSKKNHPHAWKYIELYRKMYLDDDPEFYLAVRLHIMKLRVEKGFPDIQIQNDGYLYSPTAGDLVEEKLAEILCESGSFLPRELEKIPLRVLGRVKYELKERLSSLQEITEIESDRLEEPAEHLDEIWGKINLLPPVQKRVMHLIYEEGYRPAEVSMLLGISRAAVTQAHSTAIHNLKSMFLTARNHS